MENKTLIGFVTLLFTYMLFSWALGRFVNKRKHKNLSEFQNFLSGAWMLGLVILFLFVYLYLS